MHSQYTDNLNLAVEPTTLGLPCTPHLKPSTPPEPSTTPRLRTSMSSHSRLMPDDISDESRLSYVDGQNFIRYEEAQRNEALLAQGGVGLMDLPEEIHQRILDMLMGELRPTNSNATDSNHALRNWNHAMRHPRGRKLADLSLVTPAWRRLIQERIYRHVKIQGTNEGLRECYSWFGSHPHLSSYVRHLEFWIPVWERRGGQRDLRDPQSSTPINTAATQSTTPSDVAAQFQDRLHFAWVGDYGVTAIEPLNSAYRLSSQKAALEEIFFCVDVIFQSACVLTIEGGHCKKPPMIEHFRRPDGSAKLTNLPRIRTLVMRGAWNIMRDSPHWQTINAALPNIREWHCSFTKPKSKAYCMMHSIIQHIPTNLTHLNLCLEGFYSKKTIDIGKMQVLQRQSHLCEVIGVIMPQLEALTFTGRACAHMFSSAIESAAKVRKPKLKSVDLVVKNCCRGLDAWNDGTGIHNWSFIAAFEQLVTIASRALNSFPDLNFLRIRFVDLDAPAPLLNPYFQLQNNELTGIWNDTILKNIQVARPYARYEDILAGIGIVARGYPGFPTQRPRSMRTSIYQAFSPDIPFF